ncbi:hypothetical protein QBE52_00955 [Clostridiaceae bacterium 35-E11]
MLMIENLVMHFIEGFFMSGAGLGVLGIRLKIRTMVWIASIYGMIVYGVRRFYILNQISFGTHSFILILCFMLLLMFLGKQTFFNSFIASLISLTLLTMADGILLLPTLNYLEINPVFIAEKRGYLLLAGLVSNSILIVVFMITYVFKVSFINFDIFQINQEEQ